jgi:hypothetical protein
LFSISNSRSPVSILLAAPFDEPAQMAAAAGGCVRKQTGNMRETPAALSGIARGAPQTQIAVIGNMAEAESTRIWAANDFRPSHGSPARFRR